MSANRTKHQGNCVTSFVTGGAAGDHTVVGIATTDVINQIHATTEGVITSEFTITAADTINNTGGSDTTGETVIVSWYKVDA